MRADEIPMKMREKNMAFNMEFITEMLSLCFKESPRANLRPSSIFAQSHHGQGHIERAIIELVMLDFEFCWGFVFFFLEKQRKREANRHEERKGQGEKR